MTYHAYQFPRSLGSEVSVYRNQCLSKSIHYKEKVADINDVWAAATRDPLERLVLGLKAFENTKASIPKWELDRRSRTQV